jgi:UDP-N-acetylglucosamine acyltransferase
MTQKLSSTKPPAHEAPNIHPTAVVDPHATLGQRVQVGPHSVVGPHVSIGDDCFLHNGVTIAGHTTIGRSCSFFPGAVIGLPPQDLKYHGEDTYLIIGDHNTFREHVTIHPGTANGGSYTRIGHRNLFLVGSHVAHDCNIGSNCIFANNVQLAGHVRVENNVAFGGGTGVHHFATVGKHAFVGGLSRITQDVPPFMIAVAARGPRSEIRMINGVGLQRAGFSEEQILALKKAFLRLFSRRARSSGIPIVETIHNIIKEQPLDQNVDYLCQFLLRSYEEGRNGRYLEALRPDRKWDKPNGNGETKTKNA